MRFIYPSFLWALLLIAIPIIIHLLNLRKHRTVYFSNVSLLKKVRRETKRKSKLKQYLILGSRILVILTLVLAFAKPYQPKGTAEKKMANSVVGIYIDNSFSMNAEGPEGRAIESAREKAYAIVNGSRPDAKFALLTNSLDELQNRFYSKAEINRLIADVEVSHNWIEMSTIQRRFISMMENFLLETNKTCYLISDFQIHSSDILQFEPDSLLSYNFIPVLINNVSNLYIDTCWYDAPTHHFKQAEGLNVKIINSSNEDYFQVPVNFFINDTLKSLTTIDIAAREEKIVEFQYTNLSTGLQLGRVEITDYPITYDNTIYLAYEVKQTLNTLLIQQNKNRTSKNIEALFINDGYIKLDIEQADRLQISTLDSYSAIFLNELRNITSGLADELAKFTKNGGTLIVIPNQHIDTEAYNHLFELLNAPPITGTDTITLPIGEVSYQHALFSEVFKDERQNVALPDIKWRFRFSGSQQFTESNILMFPDQTKALSLSSVENGKLYTFAFPFSPTENHFINHLLFLPTAYNMVLQSSFNQQLYNTIGIDHSFDIKLNNENRSINFMLKNQQNGLELIPTTLQQRGNTLRLSVNGDLEAGFYKVFSENNTIGAVAFNYLLKESEFDYLQGDKLLKQAKDAGIVHANLIETSTKNMLMAIEEIDNGVQLWRLFIVLGILFLLTELAIIRFWK